MAFFVDGFLASAAPAITSSAASAAIIAVVVRTIGSVLP
jgi:hypothetical protein